MLAKRLLTQYRRCYVLYHHHDLVNHQLTNHGINCQHDVLIMEAVNGSHSSDFSTTPPIIHNIMAIVHTMPNTLLVLQCYHTSQLTIITYTVWMM